MFLGVIADLQQNKPVESRTPGVKLEKITWEKTACFSSKHTGLTLLKPKKTAFNFARNIPVVLTSTTSWMPGRELVSSCKDYTRA